jgi:two-component system, NtrC family, response regulator HydG
MHPEPSPTRIALTEVVLGLNRIRTTESATEILLNLMLTTTPADRVAVLIEQTLWERERGDPEDRVSERGGVIDDVFRNGQSFFAEDGKTICLPLDANGYRLGVLYADTSKSEKRFNQEDLLLLQGTTKIAADMLDRLLHTKRIEEELARLQSEMDVRHNLLGESKTMADLKAAIARVAQTNSTVLIQGESGTGKELVARAIHHNSQRQAGPFVAVNCAAIPENLWESELFGYEKGAFTGAVSTKKGKFEVANGGTIFLDEVGDMPMATQAKVLRVLQEREVERIGGTRPIALDIRVIAATNRDLQQAVAKKECREDLYYRLNVFPIRTPALRERSEDIPTLARFFVSSFAKEMGHSGCGIHPDAETLLCNYRWPGNVRELRNFIERAMVNLTGNMVLPAHLPSELLEDSAGISKYHDGVLSCKRSLVRNAWIQSGGQAKRAAEILGVPPTSLHHLINKLGLTNELR